jgi:hypothetical protein
MSNKDDAPKTIWRGCTVLFMGRFFTKTIWRELHSKEGGSSHVVELDTPLLFARDLNMTFVHVRYLKPPGCVPSDGSTSVQPDGAEDAIQILN